MSTSAYILMKEKEYLPEKLLSDIIVSAFHADLMLYFDNDKVIEDNNLLYTNINLLEKETSDNERQAINIYIDGKISEETNFEEYDKLGLDKSERLYRFGYIEELYGAERLVFRYMYEYLKINPTYYFWMTDYKWVYNWEDMKNISSLSSFDSEWCYKNPNTFSRS